MFTIQIFHPGSGFFLNTNHQSDDLEALKAKLDDPAFAGPQYRIVDDDGVVHHGPVAVERNTETSVEDLAESLGVPVLDPRDVGLDDETLRKAAAGSNVGYTLQAIQEPDGTSIVSLRLDESKAHAILRELWLDVDFWAAPGGASVRINSAAEAETISRILGNCWISFEPGRHRWLFHVHLL